SPSVPDDIFFLHSLKVSHVGGAFSQNLSGGQLSELQPAIVRHDHSKGTPAVFIRRQWFVCVQILHETLNCISGHSG
ncbi:hypothetical protein, partial [Deinococcus sp. UYEF24]